VVDPATNTARNQTYLCLFECFYLFVWVRAARNLEFGGHATSESIGDVTSAGQVVDRSSVSVAASGGGIV
jgi:hypothetical protein